MAEPPAAAAPSPQAKSPSAILRQLGMVCLENEARLGIFLKRSQLKIPVLVMDVVEDCISENLSRRIGASKVAAGLGSTVGPSTGMRSILKEDEVRRMQDRITRIVEEYVNDMTHQLHSFIMDTTTRMSEIAKEAESIETARLSLHEETTRLSVATSDAISQMTIKQSEAEMLLQENGMKDTQLDILRDQVRRRSDMLSEQRHLFHEELLKARNTIFQLERERAAMLAKSSAGDGTAADELLRLAATGGLDLSSILDAGFGGGSNNNNNSNSSAISGQPGAADPLLIDLSVAEQLRKEIETAEQMRYLVELKRIKDEYAKDRKNLLKEKQISLQLKDQQIQKLKIQLERAQQAQKQQLVMGAP